MRIIAGRHRGRRLVTPEGLTTRPMTDRVRENLFNILAGWVDFDGAVVLDLFAGSGALGLEAMSRGARWCTFVDRSPKALDAIEVNVSALGLADHTWVLRRDTLRPGTWIRTPDGARYSLVFCDPPYPMSRKATGRGRLAEMVGKLGELDCLAPGAVAMLRVQRGVTVTDHPWRGFETVDERTYGTTTLHLMEYRAPERQTADEGIPVAEPR